MNKHIVAVFCSMIMMSSIPALAEPLSDIEIYKQQGINYYKNGYYEDALSYLLKIPYEQRDEEVYLLIANSYESEGKVHHAIDMLNRLVNLNPLNYKARYNLANLYLKMGRYSEAVALYDSVTHINKKFAPAYYNAGLCFYQLENYKQSIKYYKKAIDIDSKIPDYYFNLAVTYKAMNKSKAAKKYFSMYSELKQKGPH